MENIVEYKGKRYELVDVTKNIQSGNKGTSSCELCDLRSECHSGVVKANKIECIGCHCYKLIKEEIQMNKIEGKCPKCSSKEFLTERRPNGNSVCKNHKCNYNGKTTEFYVKKEDEKPKMKLDEICFKVITSNPKRNKQIIELLNIVTSEMNECCETAKYAILMASKLCFSYDDIDKSNTSIKEITFDEAIKLLESCKPEEKKPSGKFVEYDIDKNGCYHPTIDGSSCSRRWNDTHLYEDVNRIFAGWFWENPDNNKENGWSVERQGLDSRTKLMSFRCEYWEYPIIPTKIRFWVKE